MYRIRYLSMKCCGRWSSLSASSMERSRKLALPFGHTSKLGNSRLCFPYRSQSSNLEQPATMSRSLPHLQPRQPPLPCYSILLYLCMSRVDCDFEIFFFVFSNLRRTMSKGFPPFPSLHFQPPTS